MRWKYWFYISLYDSDIKWIRVVIWPLYYELGFIFIGWIYLKLFIDVRIWSILISVYWIKVLYHFCIWVIRSTYIYILWILTWVIMYGIITNFQSCTLTFIVNGIRCFNINSYGPYTLWMFFYMAFICYECGVHVYTMKWWSNTINFYILCFLIWKLVHLYMVIFTCTDPYVWICRYSIFMGVPTV